MERVSTGRANYIGVTIAQTVTFISTTQSLPHTYTTTAFGEEGFFFMSQTLRGRGVTNLPDVALSKIA